MNVFETPFGKEIHEFGLDCIYCPQGWAAGVSLTDRYLKAYEIKEKHGLLTDVEKQVLPVLRAATLVFRSDDHDLIPGTHSVREEDYRRFKQFPATDRLWDLFHGHPGCLQPAQWIEGVKTLEQPLVQDCGIVQVS